ncbi:KAT8 regulatory NSL complex subunit 2 [Anopheles aquasalis]|uniref:KAT8 regulatory NSL complex subunit 2 n=1 Tax=Anopheles aquasalis TaxID=42839 RepID=UPI00215AB998|nr:KAT8 regulatory NSL complex subunit 2 [Anopheles aquasalis]
MGPHPQPAFDNGGPEKAVRDQIFQDIERKAKTCSNTLYECSLPRLEGFLYCFRHILQDPTAPYKQCGYLYTNGRRCLEPSPKYDAKKEFGTNFCFEHSRQTQLQKTKSTIGKLVPVETTETLLHSLAHHVKVDKIKPHYSANNTPLKITVHEDDDDNDVDVVTPSVDPFVDVDVTAVNDARRIVLDYASDSSSNDEASVMPKYGTSWRGQDMDNSDNESVDSQSDDPLKHAGVYTAEEVTRITKEKLSRLQTLYVEQLHRLQHVLCEKRRSYLQDLRKERETRCSISNQYQETPRERLRYEKLKGLNRYHRKYGVESILQRKYLEKRAKATEGLQQKPPSLPKCAFTEGGVKCGERTLPCCKFCRKHILEDKKQVLFRACGVEKGGVSCQEPLAGLFENATCPLHVDLPAQRTFNKRKYESESEGEADVTVATPAATTATPTTKVETVVVAEAVQKNPTEASTTIKMEPNVESARKIVKQEPVTTPQRVRNTRSARAALERQRKEHEEETAAVKAEPVEDENPTMPPSVESNITIAHVQSCDTLGTNSNSAEVDSAAPQEDQQDTFKVEQETTESVLDNTDAQQPSQSDADLIAKMEQTTDHIEVEEPVLKSEFPENVDTSAGEYAPAKQEEDEMIKMEKESTVEKMDVTETIKEEEEQESASSDQPTGSKRRRTTLDTKEQSDKDETSMPESKADEMKAKLRQAKDKAADSGLLSKGSGDKAPRRQQK